MNNAQAIVRALEQEGVRWVFGVPSGPVLPFIEALSESSIEFVLTASETSAGFMATTVGHLTRTPGVCVSTLGPGATNLATGVGCAWLDRAPLLAITCDVATPWLTRRIQMRIDHAALFQPLTKASYGLRSGRVLDDLTEAMSITHSEPPGPVHLDLPEDVAVADCTEHLQRVKEPGSQVDTSVDAARQVAHALSHSRRPVVMLGLGVTRVEARENLLQFVERQRLPFMTTLHAKGCLPESHPNWVGILGRARRSDIQKFLERADLIVAIGYDPIEANYEEWVGNTPVVHLSSENAEAGPEVAVLYDGPGDLEKILARLPELSPCANDWSLAQWKKHRERFERALRPAWATLAPHHVLDALRQRFPANGILAYDVGAHNHQVASQWRTDLPFTALSTNGWSSMGFAMPAAYAAKLVHPDRAVAAVVGDGCFQMTAGELAVAARLSLPVPTIVLNDGWLGLMKVKQERRGYQISGVRIGERSPTPSHYFGVPCRSAETFEELGAALDWALNLGGPSVIETFVDVEPYSLTVYD